MEKIYDGVGVKCTEQGYLEDIDQWTRKIGIEIGKEEGIEMTDKHWEVIDFLRAQNKNKVALSIRSVGKSNVVSIKEFYALFPDGPLKKASRIAGIPKPVSCI